MRILHLIESLGLGGAERRLVNDVLRLNHRFSHTVVYLDQDRTLAKPLEQQGITPIGLDVKGSFDPRALPRLIRVIRQVRPNLVHTQLFKADCYGRILGGCLGIPVISTVQSSVYESPDPYLRSFRQRILDRWTARYLTRRLIAVSDFVKQTLIRHLNVPPERIEVIPNAIDPSPFEQVDPRVVERWREQLGIPKGSQVLITVGKLNPPKGHRFVLEALQVLHKEPENFLWLVVGDGVSRQSLEAQAVVLGLKEKVKFLGQQRQIPELLALANLFVFPSLSEGLPFALLEAMAAGKPCIAFQIGPMPEVVEDGKTGLLVKPASSQELAQAIRLLLDAPALCQRMGEAGRGRVYRLFHADCASQRLGDLYRRVWREL